MARKPFVLLTGLMVGSAPRPPAAPRFVAGAEVEVRTRYRKRWAKGFEIVAVDDDGVRLRRQSDGAILPLPVGVDDVRARQ